ncbi:MAG: hypothetical protein EBX50_18200, partial [Chitinophagia bacterium]|nr:hypothetical protein [Chitinophagia bacterium]
MQPAANILPGFTEKTPFYMDTSGGIVGAILSTRYLTISEAANALGTTRDKMLLLLLGNNGGHGNPIGLS